MGQQGRPRTASYRALLPLGLLLFVSFASFLLFTSAHAQLPEDEPTATPVPDTDTTVRLEVDEQVEPLESGREFPVRVLVDEVEHMASFDFALSFDPDKVDLVRIEDQGQFLETGARQDIQCPDLEGSEGLVLVNCITFGPPVCQGGAEGPSGSGLLATVYFSSKGNGAATFELTTSTMALDDFDACDPESGAVAIPHLRGDSVTVDIVGGGGGGSSGLLIGIIIGVAVVVLVGGAGGFLWYRRRGTPAA